MNPRLLFACGACVCLVAGGCYNGDLLVEKVRNRALRTRLDEVVIGEFRCTLPRDDNSGEMIEIDVRVYGESQRYKINEIEDELADRAPQFENEMLRVLRETHPDELIDPELKALRKRLLSTFNDLLTGEPLLSVGFHDIRFIRH